MKKTCIVALLSFIICNFSFARDHVIYSISQDIPMGYENETIKKNFYLNIGQNQGVKKGTIIDVFRIISNINPYNDRKRVNHKVKIGEIFVLHSDDEAAIGKIKSINNDNDYPLFEINGFMIGDHVTVSINE
jgi:hypothetical protein